MSGKIRRFHGINGVSIIINERHAGIRLGNDRDGNIFLNIADNRNQLIRTNRAIHAHSICTCSLQGNSSLDSISTAENTSVCVYRHGTHNRQPANCGSSIHSGQSLFDIDHGLSNDQIHAGILQNSNLLLIHFESCLIGHLPGRSHHFTTGGNIRSNVNLMVCRISDFS